MMPLMIRRSSTRRAPGWFFGNNGSIEDQAASSSQKRLRTGTPHQIVNGNALKRHCPFFQLLDGV